jgi:hypothetical protein
MIFTAPGGVEKKWHSFLNQGEEEKKRGTDPSSIGGKRRG